jgi:hypothetical protein
MGFGVFLEVFGAQELGPWITCRTEQGGLLNLQIANDFEEKSQDHSQSIGALARFIV